MFLHATSHTTSICLKEYPSSVLPNSIGNVRLGWVKAGRDSFNFYYHLPLSILWRGTLIYKMPSVIWGGHIAQGTCSSKRGQLFKCNAICSKKTRVTDESSHCLAQVNSSRVLVQESPPDQATRTRIYYNYHIQWFCILCSIFQNMSSRAHACSETIFFQIAFSYVWLLITMLDTSLPNLKMDITFDRSFTELIWLIISDMILVIAIVVIATYCF